jgi:glyoxylase-like metal-dependent hydrolase (beta-lactamase superfamily II)
MFTHHHPDTLGGLRSRARRSGLAVPAHARRRERLPHYGGVDFARGPALADGERLELGRAPDGRAGWGLTCHHTPGHDQGHMIFVEDRYRAAIAGDLVSTLSTIVIDPPEGHMATYLASLRFARELDLATLYPAHGPASTTPRKLLTRMLAHRQEREQKIVAALGEQPTPAERLLEVVYDDAPAELRGLAARSLAAGLEKLAEEGRAAESPRGWTRIVSIPGRGLD